MQAATKLPPPAKIEEHIDRLSSFELADELSGQIQRLVWNWAYADARRDRDNSWNAHRSAVKNANRVLKLVRKAMGFTYPERGEIHV